MLRQGLRTQNRICRRNLSTNRFYHDVETGPNNVLILVVSDLVLILPSKETTLFIRTDEITLMKIRFLRRITVVLFEVKG